MGVGKGFQERKESLSSKDFHRQKTEMVARDWLVFWDIMAELMGVCMYYA